MNKQTEKPLVPKLRFPEFRGNGEWEEKPLNQITTSIFDGTHQTPTYTEEGIPFFSVENIVSGKSNKFISKEDYLISTSKNKPEKGDVLITRIGNIGFSAVVDWDYDFSIYVTLAVVKSDNQFNSYYLHGFMQSERYQREVQRKSLLNAVPCKINMDELRKTRVLLPSPKEQQKIADCLDLIDELITAHTQKHDALKAHKIGLMQQLFPAEGETIPKLRFPEFRDTGEWEGKKLSKIAELTSSKRVHLSDYVPNGVPFFRGKEITLLRNREIPEDILYISEEHYEEIREKYGVPEVEDILITAVGTLGNVYRVQNTDKFYFKDGNLIWMKNISENSLFLETLLNVKRNDVLGSAIGSSQKALTMVELNKLEFMFPKKEEQQKIACCLSSIDELITAQSRIIELFKAHKKGLMQQLFPVADEVGT